MPPRRRRFPPSRLVWIAVLLGAAVFAIQGGEYGTSDLFRQRSRRDALAQRVDSLRATVDSLRALRTALQDDPVVQERMAREEFGMIRPGELLYRFTDADSAAVGASPRP